jgi:hypothetical protein
MSQPPWCAHQFTWPGGDGYTTPDAYTAYLTLCKVLASLRNTLCRTVSGISRRVLGYTWLLSDVNYEPFVGRCTLHVPILGTNPGAGLLLESIQPVICPPRVVVEEDQVFDLCCHG